MNVLGCEWEPCSKGRGSRVARISEVHSRLALKEHELPGVVIFSTCNNLIRTLPALVYDQRHPEDIAAGSDARRFASDVTGKRPVILFEAHRKPPKATRRDEVAVKLGKGFRTRARPI